jgi:hypothetical protein
MRLLARNHTIRYSPVIAFLLVLMVVSLLGEHALRRGLSSAAWAEQTAIHHVRLAVEPGLVLGGIVVSRNRHVIAGAVMGCAAGAAVGAGSAAALGLATGGIGLAALPPAAGAGCIVGAAAGIAVGYPLDTWALTLQ